MSRVDNRYVVLLQPKIVKFGVATVTAVSTILVYPAGCSNSLMVDVVSYSLDGMTGPPIQTGHNDYIVGDIIRVHVREKPRGGFSITAIGR